MRRVGTFIFGRPRPLSGDRRANPNYTLNSEEPLNRRLQSHDGREAKLVTAQSYLRTNETFSARSMSNGPDHFTPIALHASGILILFLRCGSGFSIVTTVMSWARA